MTKFKCPDCGREFGPRNPESPFAPEPCGICRRKAQQKAAAKRRREQPRVLAGVDVDAAVAWMLTLPVFVERIPKRKNGRKLGVDVGHSSAGACGGRAWPTRFKIRVYAGPGATPPNVLEVILHELTHIATPRTSHGEEFRRVLRRALEQAWELDVPLDPPAQHEKLKAYAMDIIAMEALEAKIAAGEVDTFPPAPPAPAPSRETRMRGLVEKRAAHAATMLARAETRLKRAKTLHQKWAAKVRYYERSAAKRGTS